MQNFIYLTLLLLVASSGSNKQLKLQLLRNIPLPKAQQFDFFGGYKPAANEINYVVALNFRSGSSSWFCAGTLIAHRWLLTVASCTSGAAQVKISLGASNRRRMQSVLRVSSKCFFAHAAYNGYYENDIALIQIPYVEYTPRVQAAILPQASGDYSQVRALTAGWGEHKGSSLHNLELRVVQLRTLHNAHCKGYGKHFTPDMICAQLPNKEHSCHLDSGSPLVLRRQPLLIGIASFGTQLGCKSNAPLGYTRITAYVSWINNTMQANENL
ncbi:maker717 [Drosophila busckii]|uniref:Maker717 n=1 Tax=Drosophila busckii TaxID=30019 RepID=A0A0M4EAH7_DROBS|nr:serine protease 1 [Drosophila busckii]ALC44266.1 maker717 [Drosophila busckii]